MVNIPALLDQVTLLNKLSLKGKKPPPFNMFLICGVNHYENTHSAIVASLLDPCGTHGFESQFLEAFLDTLRLYGHLSPEFGLDSAHATVKTEVVTTFGRIDIVIADNKNKAILLENKIYAKEQEKQLKRYYDYATAKYNDSFVLYYLTLRGDESLQADRSIYTPVSYDEVVLSWLAKCIHIAARNGIVRETLIQYETHLQKLAEIKTNNMNPEITQLLATKENFSAAFAIANHIDHVRNHIINTVLIPQLEELALEMQIVFDKGHNDDFVNKSYSGFSFIVPHWQNYKVFVEFVSKGLKNAIIGLMPKFENSNTIAYSALHNRFSKGNGRCPYDSFPRFTYWNDEAMQAILNGEMKQIFKDKLEEIMLMTANVVEI